VTLEVVEFTDPACPWAWGSEPAFRRLRLMLAGQVRWRRVFGILFDLDDDPPPDPDAELAWYRRHLAEITGHTRAPRPHLLAWLSETSWPASLAAKAAENQGPVVAEAVLRRLRESTFVLGEPADTPARALAVTAGVAGLDHDRLAADIAAPATYDAVRADWLEARQPRPEVLDLDAPGPHGGRAKLAGDRYRYALPTLLCHGPNGHAVLPGWRTFDEYLAAVRRIAPDLSPTEEFLDPDSALELFRSLTEPELEALTGNRAAPANAVRVDTGNGPLWLHPDEAAAHPVTVARVNE
jgi:predicted DsbA family dithiol-disulfide isomerase